MKLLSLLALLGIFAVGCGTTSKEKHEERQVTAKEQYDESLKQAEEEYHDNLKRDAKGMIDQGSSVQIDEEEGRIQVED